MLRLWLLALGTAPVVLVVVACGGSDSHSDSHAVTPSAGASQGGAGLAGGGSAQAGNSAAGRAGGGAALGGGGSAGQAVTGGAGQAAGGSFGGAGAAGSAATGGSANVAGTSGSAGAQSSGGTGWIVPAVPGAGWTGPQDPACPSAMVSRGAACMSPVGTRCRYPEPGGVYTLRCQCYTSSTGDDRWWCEDQASFGFDSCPVAYPGNGSCPNIGDVTCTYVADQGKLQACNCLGGTSKCFPWGL